MIPGEVGSVAVGWGALALMKLMKPGFSDVGGWSRSPIAPNGLKHIPGTPRDALDSSQHLRIGTNTINPLIYHTWLRPGAAPGGDWWSSLRSSPLPAVGCMAVC